MRAGQLRHRVTIRRRTDAKNARGGLDPSWSTLAPNLPASVVSLNGREAVIGQVLQGTAYFEITIRYRADIKVSDQLLLEGRELNVHSAEDREGRRQWLVIQASTEAAQGA